MRGLRNQLHPLIHMKKLATILLFLTCRFASGQNVASSNTVTNGGVSPTPRWVAATADSSTDFWTTASDHGLSNGDAVVFKTTNTLPAVSGDLWSATTVVAGRIYYVYSKTNTTFQLVDYAGDTSAVNMSGTGTGTHSVNLVARRNLVLGTNRDGAILAQTVDSTVAGGNERGSFALDLQRGRTAANQVAESPYSTILNGFGNRVTSSGGGTTTLYGMGTTIASGWNNTYSALGYGSLLGGVTNSFTGSGATALVFGAGNNIYGQGSGQSIIALGSIHLGGCQDAFYGGGFHNLVNGVGSTDLGTSGAQINAQGAGNLLTGSGGSNMQVFGAGVHAYWTGCEFRTNHGNKDKAMIRGNLVLDTSTGSAMGTIANGGTRTNEFSMMGYYADSIVYQATDVNTGTDVLTGSVAMTAGTIVRVSSTDDLPAPLAVDTSYYVVNPSGLTYQLSLTNGGAAINLTTTGTGVMHVMSTWGGTSNAFRWCRLYPSKLYTFNFTVTATLKSATTPAYAVWQRRATYLQGATIPSEPTLVGSVQTVGTDVGSNAGSPPASWAVGLTTATDGLHVTVTVLNGDGDGTARNVHATAAFEAVEINTL